VNKKKKKKKKKKEKKRKQKKKKKKKTEKKRKQKKKKKKKRYTIPVRKFLPFNLVSHLIQVLDLFDEFWLFLIFELLLDYFELVS
jgi:cobalamin-dependent methionine synthase I